MKTNSSKKVSGLFIVAIFLLTTTIANAGTKVLDWYGNHNFQFTNHSEYLNVQMDKNPWESFTLSIDANEFLSNPVVCFDVKTSEDITLRTDLSDGDYLSGQEMVIEKEVMGTNMFYTLTYDFSEIVDLIDADDEVYLIMYVNPGMDFQGEISIRYTSDSPEKGDFKFSDEQAGSDNEFEDTDFAVYPSPANTFTNVTVPESGFQYLKITDMNGKVVANYEVSFYAGSDFRIDLNNYKKGYYLVQLIGENQMLTEKLIVN